MRKSMMSVALMACALAACGEPTDDGFVELEPLPEDGRGFELYELDGCAESASSFAVSGSLYEDTDKSSRSRWAGEFGEEDVALAGDRMELLGEKATWSTPVCEDGSFGFLELPEGDYFARPVTGEEMSICTSSTHGRRFAEAMASGGAKMVVFGDSLPHYGPQPWWPERFEERASAVAPVDLHNIAVPGATSIQWLPGSSFWTRDLEPHLADADIFIFSVGGNDLFELAQADLSTTSVGELAEQFEAAVVEIEENVRAIVEELRAQNPDADIVYLVYPDYGNTTRWQALAGNATPIVTRTLRSTLTQIRANNAHYKRLTYLDLFGATVGTDFNDLLIDELHFNEKGHAFVAEELFRSLGGVRVEGDAADTISIGLAP